MAESWIAEVEASEAAMIAAGVSVTKAIRLAAELANAHCRIQSTIREALETRHRCEEAAKLCKTLGGSTAASAQIGRCSRTVRRMRERFVSRTCKP